MRLAVAFLVLGTNLLIIRPAFACHAIAGTPFTLVRDADVIVRVHAVEELGTRISGTLEEQRRAYEANRGRLGTDVIFDVLEVLKGRISTGMIRVEGELTDRDDPNERPVPYDFIRPGGRSGNCVALHYRRGAEFLLFLRAQDGQLSPYWASLTATNEQLFGPDDKWLSWVRQQLKKTSD